MDTWSHGDLFRLYVALDHRYRRLLLIDDDETKTVYLAARRVKDLITERVTR